MQFLLGFTNLYSFYIQNANNESDLSDKRAGLIQPNKSQIYTQLIDSPLINSTTLILDSNKSFPITIPSDQVLQNITIENARFNQTRQFIQNPSFEEPSSSELWTLNSSSNDIKGLSLLSNASESAEIKAMQFLINGSESWEFFTPFDQVTNLEKFNSINRWEMMKDNIITNNYTINIDQSATFSNSFAVKSKVITNDVTINQVWGEINHTFQYTGLTPINSIYLNFTYAIYTTINNTANLSVWWGYENGTRILIENWSTQQSNPNPLELKIKNFQSSELEKYLIPFENSTIIIRFEHLKSNNTALNSEIWVDDIYFAINNTGKAFEQNELITIEYQTKIDTEIIAEPLFSFDSIMLPLIQGINFSQIEFGIYLNNYTQAIGILSENVLLGTNNFKFSIPISTKNKQNITIGWYFRVLSSDLRFNASQNWAVLFDNVTLNINTIVDMEIMKPEFTPITNQNDFDMRFYYNEDFTKTNISIHSLNSGWTYEQQIPLRFWFNSSDIPQTLNGTLTLEFRSWRDFIMQSIFKLNNHLQEYLDELNMTIHTISPELSFLTKYQPIYSDIINNKLYSALLKSIELDPRLGSQLIGYLQFHARSSFRSLPEQLNFIRDFWNRTDFTDEAKVNNTIFNEKVSYTKSLLTNFTSLSYQDLSQNFSNIKPNATDLSQIRILTNNLYNILNRTNEQDFVLIDLKLQQNSLTYQLSSLHTIQILFRNEITILGKEIIIPWIEIPDWQEPKTNLSAGYPAFFSQQIPRKPQIIDMSMSQNTFKMLKTMELIIQFTNTLSNIQEFFPKFTNNIYEITDLGLADDQPKVKLELSNDLNSSFYISGNKLMGNSSQGTIIGRLESNSSQVPWDFTNAKIMGQIWIESQLEFNKFQIGPQFCLSQLNSYRLSATAIEIPLVILDSLYMLLWFTQNQTIGQYYKSPIIILWAEQSNQKTELTTLQLDINSYSTQISHEFWRNQLANEIIKHPVENANITVNQYQALSHIILPSKIIIPLQWSTYTSDLKIPLENVDILNSSRFRQQRSLQMNTIQKELTLTLIPNERMQYIGTGMVNEIQIDFRSSDRTEFPWVLVQNSNIESKILTIKEMDWEANTSWTLVSEELNNPHFEIQLQIHVRALSPIRESLNPELIVFMIWITFGIIAAGAIFLNRLYEHVYPILTYPRSMKKETDKVDFND